MNKSILEIQKWNNTRTSYTSVVATLMVAVACLLACESNNANSGIDTVESKTDSLEFIGSKEKIYLSAKTWGIGGGHEELKIYGSSSPDSITLYTSDGYYKQVGQDSLILYAAESAIPKDLKTKIGEVKVHIIGLITQAEVSKIDSTYSKNGLIKISAIKK